MLFLHRHPMPPRLLLELLHDLILNPPNYELWHKYLIPQGAITDSISVPARKEKPWFMEIGKNGGGMITWLVRCTYPSRQLCAAFVEKGGRMGVPFHRVGRWLGACDRRKMARATFGTCKRRGNSVIRRGSAWGHFSSGRNIPAATGTIPPCLSSFRVEEALTIKTFNSWSTTGSSWRFCHCHWRIPPYVIAHLNAWSQSRGATLKFPKAKPARLKRRQMADQRGGFPSASKVLCAWSQHL